MDKYNKTWEVLHQKDYFKNHKLYNKFETLKPHNVSIYDIKGKCVLDIGAGFGRHMAWFAQFAEFVYGIDVSDKIIKEANVYLTKKKFRNFKIFPVDAYKNFIYNVDYVFCRYVFQHISKTQFKEYILNLKQILNKGGRINFQFRVGTIVNFVKNKEPRTEYTVAEVTKMLNGFTIDNIEYTNNNAHIYILGTKK